ncbi:MAG: hypothetical protein KTR24_02730 [Saprospiraceae bacterium]|nr:hypothetical protein [Saprospiraceae bacterium]
MSKKKKKKKRSLSPIQHWIHRWGSVTIVILAAGLYLSTLRYGYVLDDAILITDNAFTKKGLDGIGDIFSYDTFRGFFQTEGKDQLVAGGRYRPLTHAMFAIEYALWGQQAMLGHLINVLCYVLLCLTLFKVLQVLLPSFGSNAGVIAFTTTLLFVAHPVHTEVVANIKSRDEIVALWAALGSFYYWLQYLRVPSAKSFLLTSIPFLLALLAKESVVTFLAVMPLAALMLFKSPFTKVVRASVPILIGFILYMVIRISALGWGGETAAPMELMNNPFLVYEEGVYRLMTLSERIPLILLGLGKSLQLTVFPITLTHDYYPRYFNMVSFADLRVLASASAYILLFILILRFRKKKALLAYGIAWFLITLALTSNLFFPIGTHLAERFLFIPTVGFSLTIAFLLHQWSKHKSGSVAANCVFALLICVGMVRTTLRNPAWRSNYTLFTTDVAHSHRSAKVRNSAAGELIGHAQTLDEPSRGAVLSEAIKYLDEAIEIHPHYKNAFLLRGNAELYREGFADAIANYEQALLIDPQYQDAIHNRAIAHRTYGKYYGEQLHNIPQALTHLLEAYKQLPRDFETLRLLGVAYGNLGDHHKAVEFFELAHEIDPANVSLVRNLQAVYSILGQAEKSQYFRQRGDELESN